MRASDAERDAAAAGLREHFASGRRNADELDQRLTAAFAARTHGDLGALFTDLPGGRQAEGERSYGPGPFGAGPFGARAADWERWSGPGPADAYARLQARGGAWRASAGRSLARLVLTSLLVWALLVVG